MSALNGNTGGPGHASPDPSDQQVQHKSEQVGYPEFRAVLETVNASALLARLKAYRFTGKQYAGPKLYTVETMWAAFLLLYWMNLPSINELIRRLQDSLETASHLRLRGWSAPPDDLQPRLCEDGKPPRPCWKQRATPRSKNSNPCWEGFGEEVSIDSTTVPTNGNPWRKHGAEQGVVSDPEASWTAKNSVRARHGGKEFHYGYKFHALADANWNIPICGYTTTASQNDFRHLTPLVDKASEFHKPKSRHCGPGLRRTAQLQRADGAGGHTHH